MDIDIRHEPEATRFSVSVNGHVAYLNYEKVDDETLDYRSTFVPREEREQGIGSALVEQALRYARDEGYKVVPSCPFVESFIDEHPEYDDLVASS